MTLRNHLISLGACMEAMKWAGDRTAQEAWKECQRADWLLWWAARTSLNTHQAIVLTACLCARRALRFVAKGELRPLRAIEAAEHWAVEPTTENAQAAARAARAARVARAAVATRAALVAVAAAVAAVEAELAAELAAEAAAWAALAASAAAGAAWAAAGANENKEMCKIIRLSLIVPFVEGV